MFGCQKLAIFMLGLYDIEAFACVLLVLARAYSGMKTHQKLSYISKINVMSETNQQSGSCQLDAEHVAQTSGTG